MSHDQILSLGLIDVTTKRQEAHGTRMYRDPRANNHYADIFYTVHANGYVRRRLTSKNNPAYYDHYQLNPQTTQKQVVTSIYTGDSYTVSSIQRIMLSESQQYELLHRCVQSYRNKCTSHQ